MATDHRKNKLGLGVGGFSPYTGVSAGFQHEDEKQCISQYQLFCAKLVQVPRDTGDFVRQGT